MAFSTGDTEAFSRVSKANADIFTKFSLDQEHVTRRVRLNTFALVCATTASLSFADIASKLSVEEDAVEFWVIDGTLARGEGVFYQVVFKP